MIAQTAQFKACSAAQLYNAYLCSAEHSAMTARGQAATFHRAADGDVTPNQVIVMSWRNKAWDLALDSGDVTGLPSTVVLTFRDIFVGAEIQLAQVNVPSYKVRIPDTGEVGQLSEIVNTHWSVLYWDPMRQHFQQAVP